MILPYHRPCEWYSALYHGIHHLFQDEVYVDERELTLSQADVTLQIAASIFVSSNESKRRQR
jgi:hypothetical protein